MVADCNSFSLSSIMLSWLIARGIAYTLKNRFILSPGKRPLLVFIQKADSCSLVIGAEDRYIRPYILLLVFLTFFTFGYNLISPTKQIYEDLRFRLDYKNNPSNALCLSRQWFPHKAKRISCSHCRVLLQIE